MKLEEKSMTLYACASIVSFSAIAYELVLGTYATFLLGSSVFQYTLVFSVMMASMGAGAALVHRLESAAHRNFVVLEILLAILSIASIPILYWSFARQVLPQYTVVFFVILLGLLIGLEVPLLNTVRDREGTLSKILFADYIGGFGGGLLFPLILLPLLGFFRVSAVLALLNLAVGLRFLYVFRIHIKREFTLLRFFLFLLSALTLIYLFSGEVFRHFLEMKFFGIKS